MTVPTVPSLPQIDQTNWHWHLLVSYLLFFVFEKNIFGIPGLKKKEHVEQLPDLAF